MCSSGEVVCDGGAWIGTGEDEGAMVIGDKACRPAVRAAGSDGGDEGDQPAAGLCRASARPSLPDATPESDEGDVGWPLPCLRRLAPTAMQETPVVTLTCIENHFRRRPPTDILSTGRRSPHRAPLHLLHLLLPQEAQARRRKRGGSRGGLLDHARLTRIGDEQDGVRMAEGDGGSGRMAKRDGARLTGSEK
ncbi:integrating conjugative element protein [Striga asiatica]|uniref:Integrating conjugative element protein n=1 Tax=Striga asiatica TaxID=4170 RepID=A0A5A7RGX3_STRAF|nr:integrating conjugative element protein [Striga asiatica]